MAGMSEINHALNASMEREVQNEESQDSDNENQPNGSDREDQSLDPDIGPQVDGLSDKKCFPGSVRKILGPSALPVFDISGLQIRKVPRLSVIFEPNSPQFLGFSDVRYRKLAICSSPKFFWELPRASIMRKTLFSALEMLQTHEVGYTFRRNFPKIFWWNSKESLEEVPIAEVHQTQALNWIFSTNCNLFVCDNYYTYRKFQFVWEFLPPINFIQAAFEPLNPTDAIEEPVPMQEVQFQEQRSIRFSHKLFEKKNFRRSGLFEKKIFRRSGMSEKNL